MLALLAGLVVVTNTAVETVLDSEVMAPGPLPGHLVIGVTETTSIGAGTVFTTRLRLDGVEVAAKQRTSLGWSLVWAVTPATGTVELTGQWSAADPACVGELRLLAVL